MSANIAKNTSYLTLALVFQKVISFTYFTILARNLIPEQLGTYYFAISFTTVFAIFIDVGLANVLMREIAKRKDKAQKLLGTALMIKLPLALLSIIAVVFIINVRPVSAIVQVMVYISCVSMLLDSFTITFYAVLRGLHNLKFESFGSIIFQLIVLIFGLSFLKLGLGLAWLMAALALASIVNFVYSALLLNFKFHITPLPTLNWNKARSLILITIPFAMFAIFQRLYMYLDTVLLQFMAGERYVGLYQIAFKIVFALQFLPMAFIASVYPAFAAFWQGNKKQLPITFERALNYLMIISLPISAGVIVIADRLLLLFKPEYADAVLPLRLIMIALIFIFINFPIGSLLNACDRQKINTLNMGLALAISVIMNLILIPRYQASGAAFTVIITNAFMFIFGMIQVPKIIKLRPGKLIIKFLKTLTVTLAMVSVLLALKNSLNIFVLVMVGVVVYASGVMLIRVVTVEDIRSVRQSFMRKTSK